MKSNRVIVFILLIFLTSCGGNNSTSQPPLLSKLSNTNSLPPMSGPNVIPVSVNGSTCGNLPYPNKLCASVKICAPTDPGNCQVVNDILVDTGSVGLRVFKSVLNTPLASALTPVSIGSNPLAECAMFGDGASDWGPVMTAAVTLGGEPAVTLPIHVLDSSFGDANLNCQGAEHSPTQAGLNGILGVAPFAQDCGTQCVQTPGAGIYFACVGANCSSIQVAQNLQVRNPVSDLPKDNNGVIIELPQVPAGGAASAEGYMILGINTQTNNVPSGVTTLAVDDHAEFPTIFANTTYSSFLDTGSNGYFFSLPPSVSLPDCASEDASLTGWYCPTQLQNFQATLSGIDGIKSIAVTFQIGDAAHLKQVSAGAAEEIGGQWPTGATNIFDWGLPFYFGRNVYFGLKGTTSSLGTGPYLAF